MWFAQVKVLLDECVDARLAREIIGHQIQTVPQVGWAGLSDGDILRGAEQSFDVFVTTDTNLEYQQNLQSFDIAVIMLHAASNRLRELKPLVPRLLSAFSTAPRRQATSIS